MLPPGGSTKRAGRGPTPGHRYCPPRRIGLTSVGSSGDISWARSQSSAIVATASVGYVLQEGGLRLHYTHTRRGAAPQRINEVIPIVRTATRFGGQRHWFECPACSRRCRLIYGGSHFRCRHCHGARYASQYEGLALRISRRRWRIRQKLEQLAGKKWPFGFDDGFPPKPRRMRWAEYDRLEALDEALAARWRIHVVEWLQRTDPARTVDQR